MSIDTKATTLEENYFLTSYENTLIKLFENKPEVYMFDENSTDEEIDKFFDSM